MKTRQVGTMMVTYADFAQEQMKQRKTERGWDLHFLLQSLLLPYKVQFSIRSIYMQNSSQDTICINQNEFKIWQWQAKSLPDPFLTTHMPKKFEELGTFGVKE